MSGWDRVLNLAVREASVHESLDTWLDSRILCMASKLTELYREVKGLKRDVEEIKKMLVPEVSHRG